MMHARLREEWLAKGAPWWFVRPGAPPTGWDSDRQIGRLSRHPGWRAEWYAIEAEGRAPMRDLARIGPLETSELAGVAIAELGREELAELDALAALFRPRIHSEEWPLWGDPSDAPVLDRVLSWSGTLRALHRVWPHDAYDIAGAYVGRLIIEATGGHWVAFKDDLRAELGAMVVLPSGATVWPFQRIHKRAMNPVWSLTSYMVGIGLLEPASGEYFVE